MLVCDEYNIFIFIYAHVDLYAFECTFERMSAYFEGRWHVKKKVALFFGGRSLESDISVITALQTLSALDKSEYEVEPV